jgi:hypothetical protein
VLTLVHDEKVAWPLVPYVAKVQVVELDDTPIDPAVAA